MNLILCQHYGFVMEIWKKKYRIKVRKIETGNREETKEIGEIITFSMSITISLSSR